MLVSHGYSGRNPFSIPPPHDALPASRHSASRAGYAQRLAGNGEATAGFSSRLGYTATAPYGATRASSSEAVTAAVKPAAPAAAVPAAPYHIRRTSSMPIYRRAVAYRSGDPPAGNPLAP